MSSVAKVLRQSSGMSVQVSRISPILPLGTPSKKRWARQRSYAVKKRAPGKHELKRRLLRKSARRRLRCRPAASVEVGERSSYTAAACTPRLTQQDGYTRLLVGEPIALSQWSAVAKCSAWQGLCREDQNELIADALNKLNRNGFVVLESLLPHCLVEEAHQQFRRYKPGAAGELTFTRMRAGRQMTIPPLAGVWCEERLARHPMVFALLARYLRNSIDCRDEASAESELVAWSRNGGDLDYFQRGLRSASFPLLDFHVVIDTPPGVPAQARHRDTLLPGPCSSVGVHVPLTPLKASPMNGCLGFTPGSHRVVDDDSCLPHDVVGVVPPGSVILYDSFLEHHGLENDDMSPRAALLSWYRVPGIYTGHTDENFGNAGVTQMTEWRRHVHGTLAAAVKHEREQYPATVARDSGFFSLDAPVVDWGEECVCFGCGRGCCFAGSMVSFARARVFDV
eukprot:TRINITY_DN19894_c0_g1_i1.p1 TRINITY_DN19894_c0_g1~~TRINITY_DN19894_c0_g1_i1.p1  ORF type:complete len:453 (+),score=31.78 TRINITY_DN19894_c0_g1_i1:245-1603(+)